MARHIHAGGLLALEPWIFPEQARDGYLDSQTIDKPDLKAARMVVSRVKDGVSVLNFHYLVANSEGVSHFTELHELGLFTHEEYMSALRAAYLEPHFDPEGLMGRGLYLATA